MVRSGRRASEATAEPYVLAGRLRLTMTRLSRQLRRREPTELTISQLSALASIVRGGPVAMGQLAEMENLPSPAATRLADKLEAAGLVQRQANPDDRRGVLIAPTAAGVELVAHRDRTGNAWLAERIAGLRESDRRALERAVVVLEALAAERSEAAPDGGRLPDHRRSRRPRHGIGLAAERGERTQAENATREVNR